MKNAYRSIMKINEVDNKLDILLRREYHCKKSMSMSPEKTREYIEQVSNEKLLSKLCKEVDFYAS